MRIGRHPNRCFVPTTRGKLTARAPSIRKLRLQIDRLQAVLKMAVFILQEPVVRNAATRYGVEHVLKEIKTVLPDDSDAEE